MTATLPDAYLDLSALLVAAGVKVTDAPGAVDGPVAVVFSDGTADATLTGAGVARWSFRVVCLGGGWDQAGAASALAAILADVVSAIVAAPGWVLGRVAGDRSVRIAGADRLAADVFATTSVQL